MHDVSCAKYQKYQGGVENFETSMHEDLRQNYVENLRRVTNLRQIMLKIWDELETWDKIMLKILRRIYREKFETKLYWNFEKNL